MRQILIYLGEEGYWVAECPSLPGCVSQGKTRENAIKNIKEAMAVYVSVLKENRLSVPRETFSAMSITAWIIWMAFVLMLIVGLLFTFPGQIILLSLIMRAA